MSRLLDRLAAAYFAQQVVDRGKSAVGRRLRPHLGRIRCRTSWGMWFDADPVDLIQYSVLTTGEWEPEETAALRRLLRPGDVVYDVGANVGYFTLLAAHLVGASGHVYAFEPNEQVLPRLRHHLAINDLHNVTVVPVALADRDGHASFHAVGGANSGMSSLRADVSGDHTTTVELARLDSVVSARRLRPPDVVKMDIEGAEYRALAGMEATCASAGALSLLVEVSDRFLRQAGGSEDELLALLERFGFRQVRRVSRHPRTEPDGRPFQYTALFQRGSGQRETGAAQVDLD
jgi:FkbM family methyltransferase